MDIDKASSAPHGAVQASAPDRSAYRHGVIHIDPARIRADAQIERGVRRYPESYISGGGPDIPVIRRIPAGRYAPASRSGF